MVDITNGTSLDCNANGIPDECDVGWPAVLPPVPYATGQLPWDLTSGDFDGDGDLDLAVADLGSDDVAILLNLGDGSFAPAAQIPGIGGSLAIANADLDGDGDSDMVVASGIAISALDNPGNAQFRQTATYLAPINGVFPEMVLADLDGDGDMDVAGGGAGLVIVLNQGDGSIAAPQVFPTTVPEVSGVAASDFDADGDLDLACSTNGYAASSIVVFGNDGTAAFTSIGEYPFHNEMVAVVAADLDGDADADLAALESAHYPYQILILLNDGDGSFQPSAFNLTGPGWLFLTAPDIDADGDADLVPVNYLNGYLSILENTGNVIFQFAGSSDTGTYSSAIVAADFNADGRLDLAVASHGVCCPAAGGVTVLLNSIGQSVAGDCNGNEVPDTCEIASGTAPDTNGNGVIDDCEGGSIVLTNPPPGSPYLGPGHPYRDVLQSGTGNMVAWGIGGPTTPPSGDVTPSHVAVAFDGPAVVQPATVQVACSWTGDPPGSMPCPTVVSVGGSGSGPYTLTLSGPIPPRSCTTLTFTNADPPYVLRYESLPGDVDLNGRVTAADVLALLAAIAKGSAGAPENPPRYDITRTGGVNFNDVTRLIQLLNGESTVQPWIGKTLVPCAD